LLGDLNDRCKLWTDNHSDSELGLFFSDLIGESNLDQLINVPTREGSILDLFITNSQNLVSSIKVVDPFDHHLDHKMLIVDLTLFFNKNSSYTRLIRKFSEENLTCLNCSLKSIPWQTLLLGFDDVNACLETFYFVLNDEINKFIPTKKITFRDRDKPGMTNGVRNS